MVSLISIGSSLVCSAAVALAVRNRAGKERRSYGLATGLPSVGLLTAWAMWQNQFPASLGPFTFVTLWVGLTYRSAEDGQPPQS
jgi:hypothetical protein